MADKEETRQPDRVAHGYREEVPEFVVTRHELRQLARYWYDERLASPSGFTSASQPTVSRGGGAFTSTTVSTDSPKFWEPR